MDNSFKTLRIIIEKLVGMGSRVYKEGHGAYEWLPIATNPWLENNMNLAFTVQLRGFQRMEGASIFVILEWIII